MIKFLVNTLRAVETFLTSAGSVYTLARGSISLDFIIIRTYLHLVTPEYVLYF